ncbi:MAG TPA: alpha-amylase family glycosyl hydrolase, partial [Candidatus Methylomirabilis sp.]|nr:alpha-amylase family glycosyl hydrolase [Candidatus Methylomirabilis sp.]
YFLMLDRFSDGREDRYRDLEGNLVTTGATPLFTAADNGNAVTTDANAARWREAGTRFVGGTLSGLETKLGYLKRLGVTAVWISPVFKQVPVDNSYHGYGIQDFLDVDPHFGTRDDLRRLVTSAHTLGIRVILDVILNHSGDVFAYDGGDPAWTGQKFAVRGFRDPQGAPGLPFGPVDLNAHPAAFPDGAIWPFQFQTPDAFTREGQIQHFDDFPEFADGDFFSLKDLHHGERHMIGGMDHIDEYAVSPTLRHLCEVYKFWIAFADIDGFRLDTVKHMDPGAARFFASVIHEFAQALGKDDFYIIGEITGGREFAFDRLETTGLDAALGISDERVKMTGLVKGEVGPTDYFDLFRNSFQVGKGSHTWFRNKIVTSVDDHDHVDQGAQKHRFCAGGFAKLALPALALNATTLGIPCIYYGTEQCLDGEGGGDSADRYIREAMFGGEFGAFRSRHRHVFDESQPVYRELAKIHDLRHQSLPLRRGRQYLRQISGDGRDWGFPQRLGDRMRSIVAWSRLFDDEEVLCAINTDPDSAATAFVTVDDDLHAAGSQLTCLYSIDATEIGRTVTVEPRNGKAISLTVPPAGFVVYH